MPRPRRVTPPATDTTTTYRPAVAEDCVQCIAVRGRTRQNAVSAELLHAKGIALESWPQDIRDSHLWGMVCLSDQVMVGYCFGDRRVGEVVLLALLPAWEARGIGRLLLQGVIDTLYRDGLERAGLDCRSDPGSLSCAGYRHLGWRSTGDLDAAQDELLDYVPRRTLATCPPDIH